MSEGKLEGPYLTVDEAKAILQVASEHDLEDASEYVLHAWRGLCGAARKRVDAFYGAQVPQSPTPIEAP